MENASIKDFIKMLKEMLAKFEGQEEEFITIQNGKSLE